MRPSNDPQREKERAEIAAQVAAFEARGGKSQKVADGAGAIDWTAPACFTVSTGVARKKVKNAKPK